MPHRVNPIATDNRIAPAAAPAQTQTQRISASQYSQKWKKRIAPDNIDRGSVSLSWKSAATQQTKTPLIPIPGLAHIGIRVHDLERSVRFYEPLGFRKTAGPIGPEPVAILDPPRGQN
jgi:catechol-2,3-dioxygenase